MIGCAYDKDASPEAKDKFAFALNIVEETGKVAVQPCMRHFTPHKSVELDTSK
ncbi:hypothetical protein D3C87_985960 [compost metagenome]